MGVTFIEYLNGVRLYNACRDLINKDCTITQIALDNGFANVAVFINKFKKFYEETPYKYKKKIKGSDN